MKFVKQKLLASNHKSSIWKLSASTMVLVLLTACGGGGGGGSASSGGSGSGGSSGGSGGAVDPVPTPAPAPDVLVSTPLVLSVAAPTYAAGSEELAAFNLLNSERTQCGFGKLTQSTQIDAAARAHADYQIINNTQSHFENFDQFPTGFTGVKEFARVIAAGYTDAQRVADNIAYKLNSSVKLGYGEEGIRGLLSAPYHMSAMLGPYQDVGLSVRSNVETVPQGISNRVILQVDSAFKSVTGPQLIATGAIATYPCQGSTGVERQLTNEDPNPVPGRDLNANPIGSPVYILLREGSVLTITSATMVETVSNASIVLRTPITSANDPNARFQPNQGYVAPDAPLRALTQHSVDIRGTINGQPFTRQFTFTTGA